jgi:exodeoxyribonuclease-3
MTKILNWNVNSIRQRTVLLNELMQRTNPDVILLQETKCTNDKFPEIENYNCALNGQKSYNGVAILTKSRQENVQLSFPQNPIPDEARFIQCDVFDPVIGYTTLISVYVPNGQDVKSTHFNKKIAFLDSFRRYIVSINNPEQNIIISGDFNIAPFDIDVHSPSELKDSICFTEVEKNLMRKILNSGFHDLYRIFNKKQNFSWWDYRGMSLRRDRGMRIDFIIANSRATNMLINAEIHKETRQKDKTSDHAPISVTLGIVR